MKNLIFGGLAAVTLAVSGAAHASLIGGSIDCVATVPSQPGVGCDPLTAVVDSNGPARGGAITDSEFAFQVSGGGTLYFDFDHFEDLNDPDGFGTLDVMFLNPTALGFSGTFEFTIPGLQGVHPPPPAGAVFALISSFSVQGDVLSIRFDQKDLREEAGSDLIDLDIASGSPNPVTQSAEPTTLVLAALGLLALGVARRRRG